MKKLLVVSLLAAALTSTAAFADMNGQQKPANAMPVKLMVAASQADGFSASGLQVAQFVITNLTDSHSGVKFRGLNVDTKGLITVKFNKPIVAKDRSTVVEAALALTRIGGKSFGWKVLAAKPGNGPTLFVLAVADPSQRTGVSTIAAIAKGPNIVFKQVANDDSIVREVKQAKAKTSLTEVKASLAD